MSLVTEVSEDRRQNRHEEIEASLSRQVPIIGKASVTAAADRVGLVARITLDPVLLRARAEQQSLPDASAKTAAESPRVLADLRRRIETLNEGRLPEAAVVDFEIVG